MKKLDATTKLKEAILAKELEKAALAKLVKEDFSQVFHSLNPINMIKSSFKELVHAKSIQERILDSGLGLGVGYISKRFIVGKSHNPLVKLLGYALQFGISTVVMKNPGVLKSAGGFIIKKFLKKKAEDVGMSR